MRILFCRLHICFACQIPFYIEAFYWDSGKSSMRMICITASILFYTLQAQFFHDFAWSCSLYADFRPSLFIYYEFMLRRRFATLSFSILKIFISGFERRSLAGSPKAYGQKLVEAHDDLGSSLMVHTHLWPALMHVFDSKCRGLLSSIYYHYILSWGGWCRRHAAGREPLS